MSVYLLLWSLALLQLEARAAVVSSGCRSPETLAVAEGALAQINQDRTNGYILSLNRLYDVSRTPGKEEGGSLYKLTIDVMETDCHVFSRKHFKQCEVRSIGDVPVYGECELSVYVDTKVKLQNYTCAIRQVPAIEVVNVCPDCPTPDDINEPVVKDTVQLSLKRFNKESRLSNYFTLENITRASSQWVFSASYFVEFTIVETVCSKNNTEASEVANCPPMDCPFAHRGFCSGSHVTQEEEFQVRLKPGEKTFENQEAVEVKCEIYEPQAATVEAREHANAAGGHVEPQHENHTHLHPHEHVHAAAPTSDSAISRTQGSLGTVVNLPAPIRSSPAAAACPGPRAHRLGLAKLKL